MLMSRTVWPRGRAAGGCVIGPIGVTDMTRDRDFKDLVRTRMAKTGESYAAARAQLTKPSRGETFESGTAEDGSAVYRMYTKLQTPEKGWSGLAIPSDLLGTRARLWLRGTLQGHPFWVAAQPMGDGNHWVTVNRQMRAEMGLAGDEEVEAVFVQADGPPALTVPEELERALEGRPDARALFEGMSHNHRKEYINWVREAKRPETRARRAADAMDRIVASGGRSGI
jgi:Bacteriocin-protection, YdeI or OmpD-Associated/Domain of unknown function (DUF1905)